MGGGPNYTAPTKKRNPNKGKGKPRVKVVSVRRDTYLVTGNRLGVSTPLTLDATIRNCIRAMGNPGHPHFRFWNQDKLDSLLAIQKGKLPFARVR